MEKAVQQQGFYRRPLPDTCVDFASREGRVLFTEALQASHMTNYFPLAAQFHTQSEPAYCGLGTLAMVLNALAIDPQRIWKGPWRWFSEELLDCCSPLEVVKKNGITIAEFVCLARCNGATTQPTYASESDVDRFRELVKEYSTKDDRFLVVSYDRRGLNQTGSGHFSPVGGYHPEKDMVLLLDVARFKYPPHWVPLPTLFAAMHTIDPSSQRSRGYISVTAAPQSSHIFSRIRAGSEEWVELVDCLCHQLPSLFAHKGDSPVELVEFVSTALAYITSPSRPSLCTIGDFFSTYEKDLNDRLTTEHRQMIQQLFDEIHSTDVYGALGSAATNSANERACCRVRVAGAESGVGEKEREGDLQPKAATIPGELATLIIFLLLRQLEETKLHSFLASSSGSPSPASSCSSCSSSSGQRQEHADQTLALGRSVEEALQQLKGLPRVKDEVGYLWASFRNIASYCSCRDRRVGTCFDHEQK